MTAQELADRFSRRIRRVLTVDEVDSANELNADETEDGVCHTHDYCDANMVMMNALGMMPRESDSGLWAEAWRLARESGFKPAEYLFIERYVAASWMPHLPSGNQKMFVEELYYCFINDMPIEQHIATCTEHDAEEVLRYASA